MEQKLVLVSNSQQGVVQQNIFLTMNNSKKTVFVGVSGGVDSSLSALLLKNQNYNVVGVFIRTWTPPFIKCTWRDERRDAMRICAHLGIPFLECDAEDAYKKGVADYMIGEYKIGRTPNPDVMCNREVKFGVFWDFAKKHGADFIATGHYAMNSFSTCEGGVPGGRGGEEISSTPPARSHLPLAGEEKIQNSLIKSPDKSKDQSYFLWTLTQEDLSHVLFPIGHLHKTDVRKLAKKYKIPVATKKDSQGVCFLGPLDMKDFLKHYIESKKGEVLLVPSEVEGKEPKVIGYHDGAVFFTLGERHGFNITEKSEKDKPLYVVGKDINKNTITVSSISGRGLTSTGFGGYSSERNLICSSRKNIITITNTNWISVVPEKDKKYEAQIRYHGELLNCKVEVSEGNNAQILFDKDTLVDSGQSIVIYDADVCLGGGIVA